MSAARAFVLEPLSDHCHCGCFGEYGYRNGNGALVWYCEAHRFSEHYAEARRSVCKPPANEPDSDYPKPPDLQELIARFGNYSAIPPSAWIAFDTAVAEWQRARRLYTAGRIIDPNNEAKPTYKRPTVK